MNNRAVRGFVAWTFCVLLAACAGKPKESPPEAPPPLEGIGRKLKALSCCSLTSKRGRVHVEEAKPGLALRLPGLSCDLALWDGEWLQGQALECGLIVASVHGRGFVPDPPK